MGLRWRGIRGGEGPRTGLEVRLDERTIKICEAGADALWAYRRIRRSETCDRPQNGNGEDGQRGIVPRHPHHGARGTERPDRDTDEEAEVREAVDREAEDAEMSIQAEALTAVTT